MCSKCSSTTRQQAHEPFFCQRTLQSAREEMREDEKPTEVTWVYGTRLQPDSQGSTAKNCQDAAVIIQFTCFVIESSCSHILSVGNSYWFKVRSAACASAKQSWPVKAMGEKLWCWVGQNGNVRVRFKTDHCMRCLCHWLIQHILRRI